MSSDGDGSGAIRGRRRRPSVGRAASRSGSTISSGATSTSCRRSWTYSRSRQPSWSANRRATWNRLGADLTRYLPERRSSAISCAIGSGFGPVSFGPLPPPLAAAAYPIQSATIRHSYGSKTPDVATLESGFRYVGASRRSRYAQGELADRDRSIDPGRGSPDAAGIRTAARSGENTASGPRPPG